MQIVTKDPENEVHTLCELTWYPEALFIVSVASPQLSLQVQKFSFQVGNGRYINLCIITLLNRRSLQTIFSL